MFDLNCNLFMHSFVHNKLPSCFESMFKKSNSLRTNNIALKICKKSSLHNLPSFILPSKWNSLAQDLKALKNRNSLKNHQSAEYLNSYKNISCNNIMSWLPKWVNCCSVTAAPDSYCNFINIFIAVVPLHSRNR